MGFTSGVHRGGGRGASASGFAVPHSGRRREALDEAVKLIDRNVTGVRGDLDRLFDTVEREKGYSSAGMGEPAPPGEITEQRFDATSVRAL